MEHVLAVALPVMLLLCLAYMVLGARGKSELEHTTDLFDKCMIRYNQQKTDEHIILVIVTGSPKIVGMNTDEIRWKFTLDGSLYAVEAK